MKWGKEKFTDVEANTDEPPVVFKAQLFALSGVPPDRQKVMMKGAVLKVSGVKMIGFVHWPTLWLFYCRKWNVYLHFLSFLHTE